MKGNIGNKLLDIIKTIFRGQLLVKLHCEKYFPQILFTILLIWGTIYFRIVTQNQMAIVETNKKILKDLRIKHAQKTIELAGFNRMSKIEALLQSKGSNVGFPHKPANRIDN